MRYRLMASYLGASYQAAVGPSDRDVTLFAAPPPPEEHGFSPVPGGGIWRKQVRLDDLDGLWESRPIGSYHGEPCLVLDDLGDRLHIVYLGMDERRAGQLGYWQVDRGVFEVVVQRHEVTDLAEERHEFPIALLLSALPRASAPPRALNAADGGAGNSAGSGLGPGTGSRAGAGAGNGAAAAGRMALAGGGQSSGAQGLSAYGPGAQGPGAQGSSAQGSSAQGAGSGQVPSTGQAVGGGQVAGGGIAAWNGQPANAGAYQSQSVGQQVPSAGPQHMAPSMQQAMSPAAPSVLGQPGAQAAATSQPQAQAAQPQAPGLQSGAPLGPAASQQFGGGAQLPTGQQAFTAPTAAAQPGTAQPGASQPQPATTQPAMAPSGMTQPGMTQQFAGDTATTAPQQGAGVPPSPTPQPANAQLGTAQPPAAVVAWHGSPVPDGNGTWYYQPNIDPQAPGGTAQNGTAQNGISQNGISQNGIPHSAAAQNGFTQNGLAPGGYAPLEPGTPAAAQPNGLTATPQFAQPAQAAGFQQTPALQQASPLQPTASGQQQFAPPLTTAAPQFQPPAAAPAPLAGTGTTETTGASGGAAGPVNLGMPLSGQVSLGTPPGALSASALATPSMASPLAAPPAAPAAPAPATVSPAETHSTGPLPSMPAPALPTTPPTTAPSPVDQPPRPAPAGAGPLSKLTGAASAVRGRRAARKPRLAMSAIFADLVDMADVPRSSYAVDEEVTGAMCLFKTDGGYEVFSCAEDARHEVRFFEDEEAAYFYLFGVLAAEALRNGRLAPRRG